MTSNKQKLPIEQKYDKGIKGWSKLYDKTITDNDYSEICQNLSGFFEIIHKWDQNDSNEQVELPFLPTEK